MSYTSPARVTIDHEGNVVGEDETRECFENRQLLLGWAATNLSDMVKLITYFTVDITDPAAR
jgi:hypothetical protein